MNTVKDKALELVKKFLPYAIATIVNKKSWLGTLTYSQEELLRNAKACACIACDEVIRELRRTNYNYDMNDKYKDTALSQTVIPYWESVREAVNNIKIEDI